MQKRLMTILIQKGKEMIALFFIGVFFFIGWYLISAFSPSNNHVFESETIKKTKLSFPITIIDSTSYISLKDQTNQYKDISIKSWEIAIDKSHEKSIENAYLKKILDSLIKNDMSLEYLK